MHGGAVCNAIIKNARISFCLVPIKPYNNINKICKALNIQINTSYGKAVKKEFGRQISGINLQKIAFPTITTALTLLNIAWPSTKAIELSVFFCNDSEIQNLNLQFRGKNCSTNVLSFPQFEPFSKALAMTADKEPIYIGDIAASAATINAESIEQGKPFSHHLNHMIVHSILHLMGFDHIDDSDAMEMENIEISILQGFGIANPYTSGSTNFI